MRCLLYSFLFIKNFDLLWARPPSVLLHSTVAFGQLLIWQVSIALWPASIHTTRRSVRRIGASESGEKRRFRSDWEMDVESKFVYTHVVRVGVRNSVSNRGKKKNLANLFHPRKNFQQTCSRRTYENATNHRCCYQYLKLRDGTLILNSSFCHKNSNSTLH